MAKVTYRGHEYDTEEYRKMLIAEQQQIRNHDLMYRGIKVKSKAIPCSQVLNANQKECLLTGALFLCKIVKSVIVMERDKLKLIVRNMELLVDALKAEIYSDVDAYKNSKAFEQPNDYDELYDDDDGYPD